MEHRKGCGLYGGETTREAVEERRPRHFRVVGANCRRKLVSHAAARLAASKNSITAALGITRDTLSPRVSAHAGPSVFSSSGGAKWPRPCLPPRRAGLSSAMRLASWRLPSPPRLLCGSAAPSLLSRVRASGCCCPRIMHGRLPQSRAPPPPSPPRRTSANCATSVRAAAPSLWRQPRRAFAGAPSVPAARRGTEHACAARRRPPASTHRFCPPFLPPPRRHLSAH